eukprot:scaffold276704_cov23-Tisochrysis_lutea.AAC.1
MMWSGPPRSSDMDSRSSASKSPRMRLMCGWSSRKIASMRGSISIAVIFGYASSRCAVRAPWPGPSSRRRSPSPTDSSASTIPWDIVSSIKKFWPRLCLALGRLRRSPPAPAASMLRCNWRPARQAHPASRTSTRG